MMAFLVYLQTGATPQLGAETWELAKGVMLTLVTLGVAYLVRGVRSLEFEVRDIRADVKIAQGGELALKKATHEQDLRLARLEDWRTKLDTVSEIERELWEGTERREKARWLRDKVLLDRPLKP